MNRPTPKGAHGRRRPAGEVLAALSRPAARRRAALDVLVGAVQAARRRRTLRSTGTLRWDGPAQRVDALLVLAALSALVEQVVEQRPREVVAALDAGATGAEIAAATGVTEVELAAQVSAAYADRPDTARRRWIDQLTGADAAASPVG